MTSTFGRTLDIAFRTPKGIFLAAFGDDIGARRTYLLGVLFLATT
jgi:hypothetical protein